MLFLLFKIIVSSIFHNQKTSQQSARGILGSAIAYKTREQVESSHKTLLMVEKNSVSGVRGADRRFEGFEFCA